MKILMLVGDNPFYKLNNVYIFSESAVTRSLHSAKETWNENKIKEIEQVLSNARRQWFSELNIHKQEPVVGFTTDIICLGL